MSKNKKAPSAGRVAVPEAVREYMAVMGKKGGAVTSAAKAAAVRENGKKGGRPRKKRTMDNG